jgi:hypothetical protein
MITVVGASAIASGPHDAASIATNMIIRLIEGAPDTHRLITPRLPGERHRLFRVAPERADSPPERWCSIGKTDNETPGTRWARLHPGPGSPPPAPHPARQHGRHDHRVL